MKTLKIGFLIVVLAIMICSNGLCQVIHQQVVVTISGIEYPGIGMVTGTYTYSYLFKLNSEGCLESMHWHVTDDDLINEKGDMVKVVDSGLDSYGIFWEIWNHINEWNTGWPISYAIEDGWLDYFMPALMPIEGSYVNMSCKLICKGVIFKMSSMIQLHINANGLITAYVVK